MSSRILVLATFLFGTLGLAFGQSNHMNSPDQGGNVNSPNNATLVASPPVPSQAEQAFEQAMKDVHFDFDKADLRPEDRQTLSSDADWLRSHPDIMITLEGDADERGSIVYNLVLSGERANTVKDALVEMGVPAERIAFATGWGKLYPVCAQSDENCWSQNRRTHFATWPPADANGTNVESILEAPSITIATAVP